VLVFAYFMLRIVDDDDNKGVGSEDCNSSRE